MQRRHSCRSAARLLPSAFALLSSLPLLGVPLVLAAGCAQEVGDIDRTQPNRIRKSVFDGEWYLGRTVIDVPYTTEFTFTGESAELERVRWEIQEETLIAFRVYDRVDGTDKAVTYTEADYQGAPIAAFRITSHFDINREYNAQTGEQTNVLRENTEDRPWHEREFMRVDWSQNLLPSLTFLLNWEGPTYAVEAPLSYKVDDPEHPHHMVVGVQGQDGSWTDYRKDSEIAGLESADYLEATIRVAVTPEYVNIEDWYGTVYHDPACWYYANADCEHQNVLVRFSFQKVPEASSYEPLRFPDAELARDAEGRPIRVTYDEDGNIVQSPDGDLVHHEWFDRFGYFRVERRGYDPVFGETESGRVYLINRHNLFAPDGSPKPIVYWLNADYPEWLKPAAAAIAKQYDEVFTAAVKAKGKTPSGPMFELRENSGQRIGDIRHNFLFYVPRPTRAGLLGYGPSQIDPLTGEIISATAYVYGAPLTEYAGRGRQIVQVLNGELTPEEIGLGRDAQALVLGAAEQRGAANKPVSQDELKSFVDQHVHSPRGMAVKKAGKTQIERPSGHYQAQLERVRGTAFESTLINDEVKLLKGRRVVGPGDSLSPRMSEQLSPVAWLSKSSREREKRRELKMAQRAMDKATFSDDAIFGLALDLQKRGLGPEEVLREIQIVVAKSTAEHELGHSLGLRHNFAGSYDALNFPKTYWDLHGGEAGFPAPPRTQAQIEGRMDEYRYSSIMEYAGRFNADIQGLGHYDRAAIMFGYAEQVEVFKAPPVDPLATSLYGVYDLRYALQQHRHYSALPDSLGGVDAMFDREFVPFQTVRDQLEGKAPYTHWEVPYRFCSDEYEGATEWCAVYDAGSDPYEIVVDAATRYRNYYFFEAFKGDRADWDGYEYDGHLWDRYFRHMLTQYQHWAYARYDAEDEWEFLRESADDFGIEDVSWALARDGGAPGSAATREALKFLVEVLATPQPGGYVYDPDNELYWRYTPDTTLYDTCTGVKEKDDPNVDCLDLNVELGVGRYSFTTYDPADGYYFYERPKWVGAFSDKVLALQALADPEVSFIGVNTGEDIQGFAIGFFLYFPEILARVSGGIINDRVGVFAGTTKDGVYYPPDPFATAKPDGHTTVDPDTWSTVQYYAIWLAMSGYAAGFDNTFNDLIHIWWDGSGAGQSLPDPEADSVATWFDATTQRTYRAVKHPDANLYSVGYEMVKRAADLDAQAAAAAPEDAEYLKVLLRYQKEVIDLAVGMWDLYGKLYF
ncbi:MAG: hypothetical protein IV100_15830 [Myxococcales bacterium]|nr:hypothetical protein [Myxococcales bacterium]